MSAVPEIHSVMVTGATGFVGRSVVRELLVRGLTPVCLVRSPEKLHRQHPHVAPERIVSVIGSLSDRSALRHAAELSQAAIHLVGIIIARRLKGQTFSRIHVRGTRNVADALQSAKVNRLIHMSALGAGPDATTPYHRTKWAAEEYVARSGLQCTVFRPSLIHGPHGEFMRLMKQFVCALVPPVIPYFGTGQAKVQPVFVRDVAHCLVESLFRDETIGQVFLLGGPKALSWIELYNACRALIPGAKLWKPLVSLPSTVAKIAAALSAPPLSLVELVVPSLGLFRFDAGQVEMAQHDSVCDHTVAERSFNLRMRAFEDELALYADAIG